LRERAGPGSAGPLSLAALPEPGIRDPHRFSPIFVLAPARSYSSVVATMLGQHPELAGLPELKLFCYRTIGELEASLPRFWSESKGVKHRSPGLVRALAEFEFGDQKPESLDLAQAWLRDRGHWTGVSVFDLLTERLSARAAVEKSPENVLTDEALERLSSAYPRARYLHLTRHPVSTQRSMQEHWNRVMPRPLDGQPMSGMASWLDAHQRIVRFTSALPIERHLRVRAEDILNHADPQLEAITTWLGLRRDPAAMEAMKHPERSPFASFGPAGSGVTGGHDPGFLRDPIPRRVEVHRTIEQPPGWTGNPTLWDSVLALATQMGYP
jgi:Sulfotransferase family